MLLRSSLGPRAAAPSLWELTMRLVKIALTASILVTSGIAAGAVEITRPFEALEASRRARIEAENRQKREAAERQKQETQDEAKRKPEAAEQRKRERAEKTQQQAR